jgi:predicted mannosyl-3-phosphoglycerate phosphatase (HAD superfamily)
MSEQSIRERASRIRSMDEERAKLAKELRKAHKQGATAAELVEWTGYSRRTIFYMLKEKS